jgi:hypothetical protein
MKNLFSLLVWALSFLTTIFHANGQVVRYETPFNKTFTTTNNPDLVIDNGGGYTTKIYFNYTKSSIEFVEAVFHFTDPQFYKKCKAIEIPLKNIDGATTEITATENLASLEIGLKKPNVYYHYTSSTEKLTATSTYKISLGYTNVQTRAMFLDALTDKFPAKEKEKYDSGAEARKAKILEVRALQMKNEGETAKIAEEYRRTSEPEKPSNAIRVFAKNNSKVARTIYWTSNGREKKELVKPGNWVQVDGIIGDTISDDSGNVKFTLNKSIELYPVVYK